MPAMRLPSFVFVLIACSTVAGTGCGQPSHGPGSEADDDGSGAGDGSGDDDDGVDGDGSTSSGGGGGAQTGGSMGVLVIDVQEAFVNIASTPDMDGIIARTQTALSLAEQHGLPSFITYEASKQGDHALHAPLQAAVPADAGEFVKTTFAATGLPSFAEAVEQSGLSHFVVLGAETDVCVLQTVLGLRAMGLSVLLERDAVFTSETNTSPALRRMEQAGAVLLTADEVAGYANVPSTLPQGNDAAVRILAPLHTGVVLNDFTSSSLGGVADPLTTQKKARLRELLLVSEWFELPVYVADVAAGLPTDLATYFEGQLRPIWQLAQDASVEDLVFAGTDGGLAASLSAFTGSRRLFVMEDALLAQGTADEQKQMLQPFFAAGLVPITYKTFYYEMTTSVDPSEWPSAVWTQKFDEYYWITQAPEDLPPIPDQ